MSRSERIAQQLGMSHGAAASRLRKLVLFRQLQKHNENVCVKCNRNIETADELSLEHVQPWENRSADLFWDLDNVAFSHADCNKPHEYGAKGKPSSRRIECPEGQAWCRTHKRFLPVGDFSKHNQMWNGIRRDCRECMKKYKDFHRCGKVSEDSADGLQPVSNTGLS